MEAYSRMNVRAFISETGGWRKDADVYVYSVLSDGVKINYIYSTRPVTYEEFAKKKHWHKGDGMSLEFVDCFPYRAPGIWPPSRKRREEAERQFLNALYKRYIPIRQDV